jgi:uncharacterized protein YbjT (DUF2867 family)
MKVLILGATGLVGHSTLVQAVTHPAITQVIAPTRTPLPPSSKLANPVTERLELLTGCSHLGRRRCDLRSGHDER